MGSALEAVKGPGPVTLGDGEGLVVVVAAGIAGGHEILLASLAPGGRGGWARCGVTVGAESSGHNRGGKARSRLLPLAPSDPFDNSTSEFDGRVRQSTDVWRHPMTNGPKSPVKDPNYNLIAVMEASLKMA